MQLAKAHQVNNVLPQYLDASAVGGVSLLCVIKELAKVPALQSLKFKLEHVCTLQDAVYCIAMELNIAGTQQWPITHGVCS